MAATIHPSITIFCLLFCSLAVSSAVVRPGKEPFARNLDPMVLGLKKLEKLTHIHLYWHDIVGGSKPTSIAVLPPRNNATMFGLVNIFDNALTVGPELKSSELVGQAQGFYASADQKEFGLLMAMNFAFTYGEYKGSTITVFGRNPVFQTVREMPVIGGTGRFRFARGYAQARTHSSNATSLDVVVEYNIYVLHY